MALDAGGMLVRLFNFVQDRDEGVRILASRVDAELNNIVDAFNTPTPVQNITYNGEELTSVLDDIFEKLGIKPSAADIIYAGTETVAAALARINTLATNAGNRTASDIPYDASMTVAQAIAQALNIQFNVPTATVAQVIAGVAGVFITPEALVGALPGLNVQMVYDLGNFDITADDGQPMDFGDFDAEPLVTSTLDCEDFD